MGRGGRMEETTSLVEKMGNGVKGTWLGSTRLGLAWLGLARRGMALRGVARRGVARRGAGAQAVCRRPRRERGNAKPRAAGSGSASWLSLAIALVRRAKVGINGRRTLLAARGRAGPGPGPRRAVEGRRGRQAGRQAGSGMLGSSGASVPPLAGRGRGERAEPRHKLGTKRGEIELAHRCASPSLSLSLSLSLSVARAPCVPLLLGVVVVSRDRARIR